MSKIEQAQQVAEQLNQNPQKEELKNSVGDGAVDVGLTVLEEGFGALVDMASSAASCAGDVACSVAEGAGTVLGGAAEVIGDILSGL